MTDTIQDAPSPSPEPPYRLPRLGNGARWSDIAAEIERDHAARRRLAEAACKEPAVDLNEPVDDARKPDVAELTDYSSTPSLGDDLEELGVAPSELPVAPELGASQEDAPTDAELEQLGAQLDEADFAEALGDLVVSGLSRPTVTYDELCDLYARMSPAPPLDPVKLTRAQMDAFPKSRYSGPGGPNWHFFGTPVELVDTVEESTPYLLANPAPVLAAEPAPLPPSRRGWGIRFRRRPR